MSNPFVAFSIESHSLDKVGATFLKDDGSADGTGPNLAGTLQTADHMSAGMENHLTFPVQADFANPFVFQTFVLFGKAGNCRKKITAN